MLQKYLTKNVGGYSMETWYRNLVWNYWCILLISLFFCTLVTHVIPRGTIYVFYMQEVLLEMETVIVIPVTSIHSRRLLENMEV